MKKYRAKFTGRELNAIGIFYEIDTVVLGKDEEDANINLHDRFEHIMHLELEAINDH